MKDHFLIILTLVFICSIFYVCRTPISVAMMKSGNLFFGEGPTFLHNTTIAGALYSGALALDAQTPDVWHQRARISFLRGDFDKALEQINTQIALHGDSFMASYYIRGLIYGYRGEYAKAEKDFIHFLQWDLDNWAANNDLAWVYFAQGKFEEAEERARAGLYKSPNNAWLLLMHGMSLYNLGRTEEARAELSKAQSAAEKLTESDWIKAYPGNNPSVAPLGLAELRDTIEGNLSLVYN